jgi:hypothetical protein
MRVIDIDPGLLQRSAQAAQKAAEAGIRHVGYEIEGDVEKILQTLAPQGPYGFTVRQQMLPDGGLKMQVQTTFEDIRDEYQITRDMCDVHTHRPLIDIRANWYLFQEVVNTGCLRTRPDDIHTNETLVLLPVASGGGITGEIFWYRVPPEKLGRGPTPADVATGTMPVRLMLLERHDRYLEALRKGDVDGMSAEMNESVQLGVRDYVNETGTLTAPEDKSTYGLYWRAFFKKYEVQSVEIMERVIQEWYLFSELRLTVRRRDNGKAIAFHTAEFFVPAKDGLFIAQIGHGTDETVLEAAH